MLTMKKILQTVLTAVVTVAIFSGESNSETITGRLKSLAEDAMVFTMEQGQEKVAFINYDRTTRWENIKKTSELATDDVLTVQVTRRGDQITATTATKSLALIPPGIAGISTEKLAATLDLPGKDLPFILIDSRSADLFDAAHIPGAVSIPLQQIKRRSTDQLTDNRSMQLIFYDQGAGGTEAAKSAEICLKAGFSNTVVYTDGVNGWLKSGRVAASTSTFIRKNRPVLIDLRNEEQVAKGHLEGAVNFSAHDLSKLFGKFPLDRRTPIVIYGENDQQAITASRTVRGWGYRKVTFFRGGTAAWLENAEVLSTEPAETLISTRGATHSGLLNPSDFEMAIISPSMVEIVDVRTSRDYKKGKLTVGSHIQLQELPLRHTELPKEKIQVVFGPDEQQAEMAYDFLKQLGYRVSYLQGSIDFGMDGKYKVR